MSEFQILEENSTVIVMPGSRLDTNTAPDVEKAVEERLEKGDHKIVFDLSSTHYISSAGLRVVLKTAKLVGQKGGAISLCNANPEVKEVLEISGFLNILKYVATREEAVAQVAGG